MFCRLTTVRFRRRRRGQRRAGLAGFRRRHDDHLRRLRARNRATRRVTRRCRRSAGFQTCRIADFQIGGSHGNPRLASLETCDTADLEVCATTNSTPFHRSIPQSSSTAIRFRRRRRGQRQAGLAGLRRRHNDHLRRLRAPNRAARDSDNGFHAATGRILNGEPLCAAVKMRQARPDIFQADTFW
jgi:hypothetical protein